MRIYFSGSRGLTYTPERLIHERKPHVMLTYYDIDSPGTSDRLDVYLDRMRGKPREDLYTQSVFMDSGAYSLYNDNVEKRKESRMGRNGRELDRPRVARGAGDYSFFNLRKGSKFREYCDGYAKFIKEHKGTKVLFVNVDAIMNPDLTWETQRFFEDEHGVKPMPVVHGLTPMKYLDRYLESGRYKRMGLGGLGHSVSFSAYRKWADEVFLTICPKSKGYIPQVMIHGFAMTSWQFMCRWPWWSVDSATWVKLSAYGWLYVPRWSEEKGGWDFDKPPMQINVSSGAAEEEGGTREVITSVPSANRSPLGKKRQKHVDNLLPSTPGIIWKWVEKCGVKRGTVNKKGEMVEFGARSHFRARSTCNLHYMKDLEESRPAWPYPLDHNIVDEHRVRAGKGLGL